MNITDAKPMTHALPPPPLQQVKRGIVQCQQPMKNSRKISNLLPTTIRCAHRLLIGNDAHGHT